MACVPPWQVRYSLNGKAQSKDEGYHPIWRPPAEEVELPEGAVDPAHRINVVRLGIQLIVVVILLNVGLMAVRKPQS